MDAVPRNLDRDRVRGSLLEQPGVLSVHHLHIWSLGAGEIAMTAHMVRSDDGDHDAFIDRLAHALDERFGINHPTRRSSAAAPANTTATTARRTRTDPARPGRGPSLYNLGSHHFARSRR